MKNTKVCPKCCGNDIVKIEGSVQLYGGGNHIDVSWTSSVLVNRYLCCNCGVLEEWIDTKEDVAKVKKKYSE